MFRLHSFYVAAQKASSACQYYQGAPITSLESMLAPEAARSQAQERLQKIPLQYEQEQELKKIGETGTNTNGTTREDQKRGQRNGRERPKTQQQDGTCQSRGKGSKRASVGHTQRLAQGREVQP